MLGDLPADATPRPGTWDQTGSHGNGRDLNPHAHLLVLDGVYRSDGTRAVFTETRAPTQSEIAEVTRRVQAPMYGRFPTDKERAREDREFGRVDALPREGKARTIYEELAAYEVVRASDDAPSFSLPELPRMRGYEAGLIRKKIPRARCFPSAARWNPRGGPIC